MGKFFRSVGTFIVAVFTLGAVRLDKQSKQINEDPDVFDSKYKDVIRDKTRRLNQAIDGVSVFKTQVEKTRMRLEAKQGEQKKLSRQVTGAKKMAQARISLLKKQGLTPEQIKADAEVVKCQDGYRNLSSSLKEVEEHIADLTEQLAQGEHRYKQLGRDIKNLHRDLQKIKQERGEAVAELITAKEMARANQIIAGIAEDGTSETLQDLRDTVANAKAKQIVTEEVSGLNTMREAEEFEEWARDSEADDDFFEGMGLDEDESQVAVSSSNGAPNDTAPLPE